MKINEEGQEEVVNRDLKNVVKNVVKLFKGWLEDLKPYRHDLTNALEKLILLNKKYNNSLIIKLSKHSQLRPAFINFCQEGAEDLIKESRVKDKISHIEALRKYF